MNKIVFEAFAYLPSYVNLAEVQKGEFLPSISKEEHDSWYAEQGYPMIGSVTVTLTLYSKDKLVRGQIEALNAKLQKERADSQVRQNAIMDQISKLQALTFDDQAAA